MLYSFGRGLSTKRILVLLLNDARRLRALSDSRKAKAPAKRVQHFIQHHTTLMFYEMLYSFGHLVVSCFIMILLYEV